MFNVLMYCINFYQVLWKIVALFVTLIVIGKMVTFSRQDYYAEQTPLMFSCCSSLGSLSGFEQHSIHDDRSSIISDFR